MRLILCCILTLLLGCSPVKNPINNDYQLTAFSIKKVASKPLHRSLFITAPEAASGYDSTNMVYTEKPFEQKSFAHNAWVSPPSAMLLSLLTQSIQESGLFYAITSNTTSNQTDLRLDTQLIELKHNFLVHPSIINFRVKVTLVDQSTNRIIASALFNECIPCPANTPYGGVLAANIATKNITARTVQFLAHASRREKL